MSEFLPFPQKKYNIIYADPPWRYSDRSCIGNAEDHYETMTFKDLCRLPVSGNGGGITRNCRRQLCAAYVGNVSHDAGGVVPDRRMGVYLQKHRVSMGKTKQERQRLLFRTGTLDAGQYGAVPAGSQGQTQTRVKRRQSAHYVTNPRTQPQAGRSTRPHRGAAGGLAAHRAVCPRGGARLGLLGQRGSNKWGVPL